MSESVLMDIEKQISRLTIDEQLWLIEKVAQRLRHKEHDDGLQAQLAAMAADPEVQRELAAINEEFAVTEGDGLESY